MAENPLKALEQKIDQLIALCNELNRENQSLKSDSAGWHRERQELLDKNFTSTRSRDLKTVSTGI